MICIKCFIRESARGEFCLECFNELLKELPVDEDVELPDIDQIESKY